MKTYTKGQTVTYRGQRAIIEEVWTKYVDIYIPETDKHLQGVRVTEIK